MAAHISDSEFLILEYLWSQSEPQTFGNIMHHLSAHADKDWKKQTVNTFLLRLSKKGCLKVDKSGPHALYQAAFSREEYYGEYARKIVQDSFRGSLSSFVSAFTGSEKLSEAEKQRLLKYIEDL